MLNFIDTFRGALKADGPTIDDHVFRLHYRVTAVLLALFATVVTAKQYVGDPIKCMANGVPSDVINYYCWIYSTYTVPVNASAGRAHPGVSAYVDGDRIRYHKYYQWVCFVLCFQAACFYAPRLLWRSWEGGRVRALSLHLQQPGSLPDDADDADGGRRAERVRALLRYVSGNPYAQYFYLARYVVCELLNLANVVGQIAFLDYYLEGEFRAYGADVLRFSDADPEKRADPMSRVFPKVTKCLFQNYGPSGNVQRFDGLCVLPLNVVNEKIFMFLWCWFVTVAAVSAANLAYRLLVVASPPVRVLLLRAASLHTPGSRVRAVVRGCHAGTWFLLYQLSGNVDPTAFDELLTGLALQSSSDGRKTYAP